MNSLARKTLALFMVILTVITAVPVMSFSGVTLIASAVEGAEVTTDGVFNYNVDEYEGEAVISEVREDAKGDITIPKKFGDYTVVLYDSLYLNSCHEITSITVPDGIDLSRISIENCRGLKKVHLGSSIESVSFGNTYALEKITVSKNNKNFTAVDGVLFNKDKTTIVKYPEAKKGAKYTVPNGVKILNGFGNSKYLKEIMMPDTVTEIGGNCFDSCKKLSKISFSSSLKTIGYSAFAGCVSIKTITLPDSVTMISSNAFADCDNLTSVKFGKKLKSFDFSAFNGCDKLKEFEIGANVVSGYHNFYGDFRNMPSLEKITVSKKNKDYTSVDGVLFTKDKKELIKYPSQKSDKEYTIPSTVETLRQCAFENCDSLEKIILNDGLKAIDYFSFKDCDNLKKIDIPNTVTSITYSAFSDCDSLETVSIGSGYECLASIPLFDDCDSLKEIKVSKKNKTVTSKDGVLYNKEMTRIIDYPYNSPIETFKVSDSLVGAYNVNGINLKSIEVGSKNKNYSSENGILYDKEKTQIISYPDGKTDKTYTVPASVRDVDISNNRYLQSFKVSSKNKEYSAKDGILYSKTGICMIKIPPKYKNKTVTISKKVTALNWRVFDNCTTIEKFVVEKGNKVFFAKNGVLFEKNEYAIGGVSLTKYPTANKSKTYTVPENTDVSYDAFDGAINLEKIYVPTENTSDAVEINAPENITVYYGHAKHKTTEKTTKASLTKNGAVKNVCTVCDEAVKTVSTIYRPKTIKLSETKYTYNGKVITPTVTVKDSKGKALKKDKDYTVKYSKGRKTPGKYSVTITFKGKYSGKKKLYFTIVPAKVTLSKVAAGKKTVTPAWKAVTGASGYEVQYSTSSKFKKAKKATVKKCSTKKTTIKKLTKGKKYYFKVRAYKTISGKKFYGPWSAVKSTKVK